MATPKLRIASEAPERNQARARLAETIAKIRDAEDRIAANEDRINALFDWSFFAQDAVDAAEAAIEKARQDQMARLSDSTLPEPSLSVRQARQKHIEAEEALADIRSARKLAEDNHRNLESSLAISRVRLHEDIATVIRDDPGVRRLCEQFAGHFREFVSMRSALSFLHSKGALSDDFKDILNEREWPELPGDRPFAEAYAALERCADTGDGAPAAGGVSIHRVARRGYI